MKDHDALAPPWTPLESNDTRKPVLLYRISTSIRDGYIVQLTDCVKVWTEALSAAQIIRKARDSNCSIDPEDDANCAILFAKLRDAFADDSGTQLNIVDDSADEELRVHVKCVLPAPLKPFKWSLKLALDRPERAVREDVVVPLAEKCRVHLQKIHGLARVLAEKDDAIAKILDKIESSGLDAGTIFPSAARSRPGQKLTTERLVQQVKGLRRFGLEEWSSGFAPTPRPATLVKLLGHAFASTQPCDMRSSTPPEPDETKVLPGPPSYHSDGRGDGDEYQRQATPPRVRKPFGAQPPSTKSHVTEAVTDGETTDEGSDDLVSRPRLSVHTANSRGSASPSVPPRRKLGTIGGRKSSPQKPGFAPDVESSSVVRPAHDISRPSGDTALSTPPKAKIGLIGRGKIGGRTEKPLEVGNTVDRRSDADQEPTLSPKKQPMAGGGLPVKPTSPTPLPSDMSDEQKADEKRQQLKRQLEAQSKMATKKKRKF